MTGYNPWTNQATFLYPTWTCNTDTSVSGSTTCGIRGAQMPSWTNASTTTTLSVDGIQENMRAWTDAVQPKTLRFTWESGEWERDDNLNMKYVVNWSSGSTAGTVARYDPRRKLREILAERSAPAFHRRNDPHRTQRESDGHTSDPRERRARETLRTVVGEQQYRRFLRHGFVTVQNPKSGYVYQIRSGHGLTSVYKNGKMVDRLCIYLKGSFPPTDEVIVRYLMAINNEDKLWEVANKHRPITRQPEVADPIIHRPLTEIYRELKGVA